MHLGGRLNSRLVGYANRFTSTIYHESASGLTSFVLLMLRIGLLLGGFLILDRWLLRISQMPQSSYFEPVIVIEFIRQLGLFHVILAGLPVLLLSFRNQLWRGWSDDMQPIRFLIGFVCLLLAWWFGTYDYNLFFNQGHFIDRTLIVAFALLVIWKPAFVLPFLLVLLPVIWQFNYPIGGYSITQVILPLNVLKLFFVTFIAQIVTGHHRYTDFIYLTFCLIGASYLAPGLGKIQLGWISYPHLDLLFLSSYAVGWLGFIAPEQAGPLGAELARFDWLLIVFTLVAECGGLLALWNRRILLIWLIVLVALNTGILLTSGILFWTWIAINLCLFFLILTRGHFAIFQIFSWNHFALAPAVMFAGIFIFRPTNLSWYDVPVSYTYRLEAHTDNDQWTTLPTQFFGQYETQFTLNSFGYLVDSPRLGIVWGATRDQAIADALLAAKTSDDVWSVEQALGRNEYDPVMANQFETFIAGYVHNFNQRQSMTTPFSWLRAPRQVWTFGSDAVFNNQPTIDRVDVYQITSFFDGTEFAEIRRNLVREIIVPI